ncbi:hypothetical protein [Yersinia phage fHe-Yen9-04]|uniref:Uncharacterized protein n=1 Tax=Yersinia phage fHe-Yen9-04 TaxID=2052742 RepID=A0A2C9CWB7_9CAUD|nr:hypothetical protein FDJ41_gp027 [Yersinia phage fHe-Yen9-04]SOK58304.1 hypothetical protein [Yersinia phage fHe-Yen9-04]VUE36073.1 hypothetical protein [Yersinia phage fHe-Yen9-04]
MEEPHTLHLIWNRRRNEAMRKYHGDGIDKPVLKHIFHDVHQSDYYTELLHYGSQLINLSTIIMPQVSIVTSWFGTIGQMEIPLENEVTFSIYTDGNDDALILSKKSNRIFQLFLRSKNAHQHEIMYGNNFIGNDLIVLQGEHVNYAVNVNIDTELSKAVKMETKKLPIQYSTSIIYGITNELLFLYHMDHMDDTNVYFNFIHSALSSLTIECTRRGYM